ncbi:MAG: hypothetical protein AAFW97_08610 [Pseudomonadota bacterium]
MFTSTAIAPVALVYAWLAFVDGDTALMWTLIASCTLLFAIMHGLLLYSRKHLEKSTFKATSIEAADRENIAFLLLYILPLFATDISNLNWQILVPTLVIFSVVVSTGYGYHFNPLLGLSGWHFYKVGTEEGVTYVLITKKELRSAKQCLTVGQLTEYIVIDTDKGGGSV